MATALLLLLFGGVFLYFGAELLVGGAAGLARSFRIHPLVIGGTVVAYGTSAPELVVSAQAAVTDAGPMVVGSLVGSNVANLGLILGITALVSPPTVEAGIARREASVMVALALVTPLVLWDKLVSRIEGAALLVFSAGYSWWTVRATRASQPNAPAAGGADGPDRAVERSRLALAGGALAGLAGLIAGGRLFVSGATDLALALGVSERVVGLTVVAVGTSLPELATSVLAARRGESDLAVGNVIGSNIFNIALCLGLGAFLAPLRIVQPALSVDVRFMIGFTLLALVLMRSERKVTRVEGGVLLVGYAAFVALVLDA